MATYNGEKYIKKQLDSLFEQTYTNWQLWVRDDGSTDSTLDILKSYKAWYPNISIYLNTTPQRGACPNFAALFRMAKLDEQVKYIMFCDQDDIWKPEKIERSLAEMRHQEQLHPGEPVLIYSNVELMDNRDNAIEDSLKLCSKIDLRNLVSFNYVLGCTMLLNRHLIYKICTIPASAVNHDYWIALVASAYNTAYISEALNRYR